MTSRFGDFVVGQGFLDPSSPPLQFRRARVAELQQLDKVATLSEEEELERMYAADCFLGPKEILQETDRQVMTSVANSMVFHDNRYWVRLPWLDMGRLPPSFDRARKRVRSLAGRLSPDEFQKYKENILELLKLEFIEIVENWSVEDHNRCYYLSHHAVFKLADSGATKMRIVFDGSAHEIDEPSLNDLLFRGPVLLPSLQGVLIRFLFSKIAIISDIEKAFLQVGVQEEERDTLRFLFGDSPSEILSNRFCLLRFRRLPFGLKCSPAILAIVIETHLRKSSSPLAPEIGRNLYVDNSLLEAVDDDEAIEKAKEAHSLFLKGGMNLRDFTSNSARLRNSLDPSLLNTAEVVKVLGVYWNPALDLVYIKIPSWPGNVPSKKEFSSLQAKMFDPLGVLRPISIKAHLLLQKNWDKTSSWDDTPNPASQSTVIKFTQQFDGRWLNIPRFGPLVVQNFRIHVFTDASFDAVGAAAYVQDSNSLKCFLILSKAKLTPPSLRPRPHQVSEESMPNNPLTVNTLEILALDIGAKLASFIQSELPRPAESYNVWSDSKCSLAWLDGQEPARNRVFVRNRVAAIRKVPGLLFRHVSGDQNPADILSRGTDLNLLANHQLWWNGPDFLHHPESWPSPVSAAPKSETVSLPLKRIEVDRDPVIPLSRSEQAEVLTISDSFLATVRYLRERLGCSESVAQDFIFRLDQLVEPPSVRDHERFALAKSRGIWFVTGRLENSDLPEAERHPIFLSKSSRILPKLLADLHSRVHPNLTTTWSSIRPFVFFPEGRRHLKSVLIKVCDPCRRAFARPFVVPPIPALPKSRVTRNFPFSFVGLDCCGPFLILQNRVVSKTYLLVITCLSTRYTHVEIVEHGTTQSLVLAFRRFVATFGLPSEILSDHAKNFELGAKVLKRLSKEISSLGPIKWQFTTPYSPWKGGVYEKMIGILKEALRKSLPKKPVNSELFNTLVAEIRALLNQRPILANLVQSSTPCCLRPVDLVFPEKRDSFPLFATEDDKDPEYVPYTPPRPDQIVSDWVRSMSKIEKFWKNFHDVYLRYLQSVGKPRVGKYEVPKVGQVVLLLNDAEKNRNAWKTAVVKRIILGHDGFCRSVVLESDKREFERPLSLIAPLETPTVDFAIPDVHTRDFAGIRVRQLGKRKVGLPITVRRTVSRRHGRRIAGRVHRRMPRGNQRVPEQGHSIRAFKGINSAHGPGRTVRGKDSRRHREFRGWSRIAAGDPKRKPSGSETHSPRHPSSPQAYLVSTSDSGSRSPNPMEKPLGDPLPSHPSISASPSSERQDWTLNFDCPASPRFDVLESSADPARSPPGHVVESQRSPQFPR
ncbi:unnamed protein product [Bursaphelenchus xylophilus]|uniref:(pine wood nematode) hypothetical protein n=1 Tax=Bursaphelenchus xylophilus TaxID=6326 RepID=A0A1I7RUN4_BURXY|nr:unnamed protein product [Bursaphelenchus xylophilus]CAG9114257.1 unnamed protein product [Bursaphelenchus xylophilus]